MPYIFGKLWHLAIIWAIRKAFQCILQGVRILLAKYTQFSPTSENESCPPCRVWPGCGISLQRYLSNVSKKTYLKSLNMTYTWYWNMISYLDLEPCLPFNVVRCTRLMRWDALLSRRSIGSCFQNIRHDWSYQFGFIIITPLAGELSEGVFKTFAMIAVFNFAFLSHPHVIIIIKSRQHYDLWHHRMTAALLRWMLSSQQ